MDLPVVVHSEQKRPSLKELELRLAESERVGYGFVLPQATAPTVALNAPKLKSVEDAQIAA